MQLYYRTQGFGMTGKVILKDGEHDILLPPAAERLVPVRIVHTYPAKWAANGQLLSPEMFDVFSDDRTPVLVARSVVNGELVRR